jgi:hypothetical protein
MDSGRKENCEIYLTVSQDIKHYYLILMKIIIYIAFVMGILFIGCVNTEGILKIKGKVIDEYTKAPIPWRDIIVQGLVVSNNSLVPIYAGYFSTDSSGCFTYSLRKVKDAYYYNFCLVGDSDYSFMTEKIALIPLERNAKYLSFSLSKLADFTILIFRQSNTPVCDTLYLSWKSNGVDGRTLYPYKINNYGLTSTLELRWIGGNVKSTIKTRAFADKRTTVRWVLFRNGKIKEIIDTITCKRDLVNEVYLKY